ncbi:MAG: DNA repair protein RadC [Candidatus Eisenbacteria bacterium]|uniref:DNA repair protein RadC n=1 Tax=Eiseniibacteriota bacterium TaxID=2212470 RepID=A0A956RS47_UNCEI|nr:DNA repair protein RadC [Candidatus Eisenbacteria bacterium]
MVREASVRYERTVGAHLPGEGPRERILRSGVESLTDRDLLAAVLGTGYTGTSVGEVADGMLREKSLEALSRLLPKELRRVRGLGTARACQLQAVFEIGRRVFGPIRGVQQPIRTPQDVLPLIRHFGYQAKEHFVSVMLNTRHLPIGVDVVSVGSISASIVHPREVFRPAISLSAASLILAHNHPSGDPSPSEEDLDITQRLRRVGDLVGIEVLDHLILGQGAPFSMREAGLI